MGTAPSRSTTPPTCPTSCAPVIEFPYFEGRGIVFEEDTTYLGEGMVESTEHPGEFVLAAGRDRMPLT